MKDSRLLTNQANPPVICFLSYTTEGLKLLDKRFVTYSVD